MIFHSCGQPGSESDRSPEAKRRASGTFTVDLHCHVLTPEVERIVASYPQKQAEPEMMLRTMGAASVEHNNLAMLLAAMPRLTTLELRLQDMEAMGVDLQVISPSPTQYYYWAEVELAREIVRLQNEQIASICAARPGALAGLGNVALQHPELAVEQLDVAVTRLRLHGVEISTAVAGLDLDDAKFEPFWARAEELGCLVFIHPLGTSLGERLNRYYLANIIGQPLETAIALSSLIFGGVLDRFPGLKILAAHGGGYLPPYVGRSDHGYLMRPEAGRIERSPGEYLKRIYFDTLVYAPDALRRLIDQVGINQIVLGTDYPFDMGHYDVHSFLASVPGLSGEERELIRCGNAMRLLSL